MWRSMRGVRWIVEKGACRQVGSGESIRTWDDRRLPRPLTLQMVGSKPEMCTLEWVHGTINREQGCSNEHLVRSAPMLCDSEL